MTKNKIRKNLFIAAGAAIFFLSITMVVGAAEENVAPIGTNPIPGGVENLDIVVNQEKLETLPAFVTTQWKVMVPLRPIAHALGYEVVWDHEAQSIDLGQQVTLQIGEDHHDLGAETVLIDGSTYVHYFSFRKCSVLITSKYRKKVFSSTMKKPCYLRVRQ